MGEPALPDGARQAARVWNTKEVSEGIAYADYDSEGLLLGIELLGPCHVSVLDSIAKGEPEPVKRFLKGSAPRELVSAQ